VHAATTSVERWLADQVRQLCGTADASEAEGSADGEARPSASRDRGRRRSRPPSGPSTQLSYSDRRSWGQSLEELAADSGIRVDALRMRRNRAIERSVSASQRDRRRSAFEPLAWALFAATISGWSSSCWPIARSGTIRPCNPAAKARADAKVIDLSSRAAQCAARSSRSSRGVASP
jgi:hypothetical protein